MPCPHFLSVTARSRVECSQPVKARGSRQMLQHDAIGGSTSSIETTNFLSSDGQGVSS